MPNSLVIGTAAVAARRANPLATLRERLRPGQTPEEAVDHAEKLAYAATTEKAILDALVVSTKTGQTRMLIEMFVGPYAWPQTLAYAHNLRIKFPELEIDFAPHGEDSFQVTVAWQLADNDNGKGR